jgi:general secretion pathway protein G
MIHDSRFKNKKSFGFTMIELLVVATIIIVLSAIGLVSYRTANIKARDGKRKGDLEQVRSALELYRSDEGTYPAHSPASNANYLLMITDLKSSPGGNSYLSADIDDPVNSDPNVYTYTSDGSTYQVCATLEVDDSSYCLNSP